MPQKNIEQEKILNKNKMKLNKFAIEYSNDGKNIVTSEATIVKFTFNNGKYAWDNLIIKLHDNKEQ